MRKYQRLNFKVAIAALITVAFFAFTNPKKITANTNYYVSNSGSDANNGKSPATAWKTMSKVFSSQSIINAGDSILFDRGETFNTASGFSWNKSGTATSQITFSNYGSGSLPVLTSTGGVIPTLFYLTGSFLTFDGLKITDTTMSLTDITQQAKIQYVFEAAASNNTFKNINISLVGIGVQIDKDFTTVTSCQFSKLRMVRNTPVVINPNDDYGANPMVVGSSNNTITYNSFRDCYAQSYDYGLDGGSVEMFGSCNNNFVAFNSSVNCNGFMEFGGGGTSSSSNNVVAYNLMVNCGLITWINGSGSFQVVVNNLQYYNNTIVSTGTDFQQQDACFAHSGSVPSGALVLKNNIFFLTRSMNVASSFNGTGLVHANNIFRLSNGATAGFTLAPSDLSTTNTLFVNINGTDPSLWDYNLATGSPAIQFGQNVGLTHDIINNPVVGNPSAGCYEYTGGVQPPPCTFTYGLWSACTNGKQIRSYTASPSGCIGLPPSDSISRTCSNVPCVFIYGSWSPCVNGIQTRTYITNPIGCTGTPPVDSVTRSCTVPPPVCVFTYGSWSNCMNYIKTRTYTVSPVGCGTPPRDSVTQSCSPVGYMYYNASKVSVYVDCDKAGTMVIKNTSGVTVKTANYSAFGAYVSVSSLKAGTYTATTYGEPTTFTK